eukprot:COSAG06_NODE_249_length_19140_cov_18.998004_23_plen_62_part_00
MGRSAANMNGQSSAEVYYAKSETGTELARHSSENTLWGHPILTKASSGRTILEPVLVALNL